MADELMDAPNQQAVRPDGSAPWEEGDGGSQNPEPKKPNNKKTAPADAPAEEEATEAD